MDPSTVTLRAARPADLWEFACDLAALAALAALTALTALIALADQGASEGRNQGLAERHLLRENERVQEQGGPVREREQRRV